MTEPTMVWLGEVYNRYKDMDEVLSQEVTDGDSKFAHIAHDLWRAMKHDLGYELPYFVLGGISSTKEGNTMEVIMVFRGENFFTKTDYGRQTEEWIDAMNAKHGVSKAMRFVYESCSIFHNWVNLPSKIDDMELHMQQAKKIVDNNGNL